MKNEQSQEDLARRYREYKAQQKNKTKKEGQQNFRNLAAGAAQGALNAAPAMAELANKGLVTGVNKLTGSNLQPVPFPYKADFADTERGAGKVGDFLGSMFMPGVGAVGKGVAGIQALRNSPMFAKMLGGISSGGTGAAAAQTSENPGQDINGANVGLSSLLGGTVGGLAGIPGALAGRQLRAIKGAREANPKSTENPMGVRSPEEAAELGGKLPENSIDLASLVGHKKNAGFYSDVLGRLPFTGVRKAEEKALKAYEGIKGENKTTWQSFKKNAKESDVKVDYDPLYKDLNEKYSSYLGLKTPKKTKGKSRMSEEDFLSKLNPEQRKIAMEKLGRKEGEISENAKRALLKETDVPILKTINLSGDKLSDAIKKYQKLGDMARSTKAPSKKSEIIEAQKLIKTSIEDSLKKSGRQDLIKEWAQANKSHINKLEIGKSLKNARERQGETFSNALAKKSLGSPTGKAVQLGIMSSLGLLSPVAATAAAAANTLGGVSAKVARSKALRDAYVTGKGIDQKGLGKEIFPVWMRALGVGVKGAPRAAGVGFAKLDKERKERKEEYR